MIEIEIKCSYERRDKTPTITRNTFEGLLAHMLGYEEKLTDLKNDPDYILRDVPFFVFREAYSPYRGNLHIHLYVPDMETAERYKKGMDVPKDLFLGSEGYVEIGMISLAEVEKFRIQTHYIEIPVDNNLSAVWEAIHRVLWDNKKGNIGLSLIRSETDRNVDSVKTDYDTNVIHNARTWEETKIVRLHGFEEDLKDLKVFSSYKELINLAGPKILEIKKIPTVLAGTVNLSLTKLPKKKYCKSREPLSDEECDTRTRRMRRRAKENGFSENEAKLKYPGRVIGEEHNPEKDPNCIHLKANSNENLIPFKLFQSLSRGLWFSNLKFEFDAYGSSKRGADSKVPFW